MSGEERPVFAEYLKDHPLRPLVREEKRALYPSAEDREAWENIGDEARAQILEADAFWKQKAWPLRTATGFLAFCRDGSRQADELPYFTRRKKLCAALLRECVTPGACPDDIVDGVWMILEETSWVISAHNVNPVPGAPSPAEYPLPDPDEPYIDLFCAQTGMILSLCGHLLGRELDAVSPVIRRRIQTEIRRRILVPFMERDDFWWMGVLRRDLNNWTPWILSNIMVCACLDPMPDRELAEVLERACLMLDRYLDIMPEDGGCDEGSGYWNMAGGALLDCLILLEKVTGGEMSFRDNEKIRNIMSFPRKMALGKGWFVNFADCDARPFISGERMERAGEMFGDPALAALGAQMRGTVADQFSDVPHLTRALDLIFRPAAEAQTAPLTEEKDEYLQNLQVRVVRRGSWALACKGGHNGENHNHNDVGSFILFEGGEPVAVDAGNMVYTAKTFSADRYTLWNIRSRNHSVPMIGPFEQREGAEHRAEQVRCLPDGMEMDIARAYDAEAGVLRLFRRFSLNGEGLTLLDEGELRKEQEITWVFLLRSRPETGKGMLRTGRWALRFGEKLTADTQEIPVTDSRMGRVWPGSLWRVTLRSAPVKRFREEFRFMREEKAE